MEGKNPYSLRILPARQKRKADASATKSKEENKNNAKRASKSETKPKNRKQIYQTPMKLIKLTRKLSLYKGSGKLRNREDG